MNYLLGSLAYNPHIQNIALALHEDSALGAYCTGGADNYRNRLARLLRRVGGSAIPHLETRLCRRRVVTVPEKLVYPHRSWDGLRTLAHVLGLGENFKDWLWERSELHFDLKCAERVAERQFDAYLGVEYGALETARVARRLNKRVIIAFLSPHHQVLKEWVFPEYDRFPELITPYVERLIELMPARTARKDQEAQLADLVHTSSTFTAVSLQRSGIPQSKIITVPLGSPAAISANKLPSAPNRPFKFLYTGPFSVRKGAHYLLQAWDLLGANKFATLDAFGSILLPESYCAKPRPGFVAHGHVSREQVRTAYIAASILVFPTLCDGFGMVIQEAFAHGLPVITTTNAGATDLIQQGKNGFVVPARDVHALAEVMAWCISHPEQVYKMRTAALETARSWTWKEFRDTFKTRLRQNSLL